MDFFEIRTLTVDDLPACVALSLSRDWEPDEAKWRLLIEAGQGFGIDDPEHGLVATVTATTYGDLGGHAVVAVGMMLVALTHERRGFGRRLMRHVLDRSTGATVLLTATRLGRPLYEKLGFVAVGDVESYQGHYKGGHDDGPQPAAIHELGDGELEAVIRRDAAVFGADRSGMLSRLAGMAERVMVTDDLSGYAFGWLNSGQLHVGPLAARDVPSATALIDALARDADVPVRIDLPPRFPELSGRLRDRGLAHAFTVPLMVHGGDLPEDPTVPYAVALMALG